MDRKHENDEGPQTWILFQCKIINHPNDPNPEICTRNRLYTRPLHTPSTQNKKRVRNGYHMVEHLVGFIETSSGAEKKPGLRRMVMRRTDLGNLGFLRREWCHVGCWCGPVPDPVAISQPVSPPEQGRQRQIRSNPIIT